MKDLKLVVYEMTASGLNPIGMIQEYLSLSYNPVFCEAGSFALTLPFSTSNLNLVSRQDNCEKFIYLESDYMGICHSIKCDSDSKKRTIKIKGTLASGCLDNSIINLVNIPVPEHESDAAYLGTVIGDKIQYDPYHTWWPGVNYVTPVQDSSYMLSDGYQGGYCTYKKFIEGICKYKNKGYAVKFNPSTSKLDLSILDSVDRTTNQNSVSPVLISTDLSNLVSSEFSMNSQPYKNAVLAFTRFRYNGTDTSRGQLVLYDEYPTIQDMPRKDIRASFDEITLEEPDANPNDVIGWLKVEGKKLLYQYNLVKAYNCKLINPEGAFVFGEDYFLGDKVTVQDKILGLTLDAQILEYTKSYSKSGEEFEPVFGFSQPTLNRILKQKGVI